MNNPPYTSVHIPWSSEPSPYHFSLQQYIITELEHMAMHSREY